MSNTYKCDHCPYMRDMINIIDNPSIKTVIISKSSSVGWSSTFSDPVGDSEKFVNSVKLGEPFNFDSGLIDALNVAASERRYVSLLDEPKKPKPLQPNNQPYYRRYEKRKRCR